MISKKVSALYLSKWLTQATRRIEVIERGLFTVKIGDQGIFVGVPAGDGIHTAQLIKPQDRELIDEISEVIFNNSIKSAREYLTRLKQIHKE